VSTREGRVGCAKAAVAAARFEGAEGGGEASSSISAVPTAVAKAEYESEGRALVSCRGPRFTRPVQTGEASARNRTRPRDHPETHLPANSAT
jgi:hypothetical protein